MASSVFGWMMGSPSSMFFKLTRKIPVVASGLVVLRTSTFRTGVLRCVWMSEEWYERFRLPFDPSDTGYGHGSDEVAAVRVESGDLLAGYYDAVHGQTRGYVESLTDDDLDRIVDDSWDPPVSLGVRLVSVADDDLEHAGQAAFVRGVGERRNWKR